jgi:hypothetical protein
MIFKSLKTAFAALVLSTGFFISEADASVINVARDGVATQSSTGFGGMANRAIDGNTSGIFDNGSVAQTLLENNPYWSVDLGEMFLVESVKIWNRTDTCCNSSLDNALLEFLDTTGNVVNAINFTVSPNEWVLYTPQDISARFIKISLDGNDKALSLAEVQVSVEATEPSSLAIFALGLIGLAARRFKKKS